MSQLPSLNRRISPLIFFRKRLEKIPHVLFGCFIEPLENRPCHPWPPPANVVDIAKNGFLHENAVSHDTNSSNGAKPTDLNQPDLKVVPWGGTGSGVPATKTIRPSTEGNFSITP